MAKGEAHLSADEHVQAQLGHPGRRDRLTGLVSPQRVTPHGHARFGGGLLGQAQHVEERVTCGFENGNMPRWRIKGRTEGGWEVEK